jgi:hypothetical protein
MTPLVSQLRTDVSENHAASIFKQKLIRTQYFWDFSSCFPNYLAQKCLLSHWLGELLKIDDDYLTYKPFQTIYNFTVKLRYKHALIYSIFTCTMSGCGKCYRHFVNICHIHLKDNFDGSSIYILNFAALHTSAWCKHQRVELTSTFNYGSLYTLCNFPARKVTSRGQSVPVDAGAAWQQQMYLSYGETAINNSFADRIRGRGQPDRFQACNTSLPVKRDMRSFRVTVRNL